jgi:Ca-activated chloride channel family protein
MTWNFSHPERLWWLLALAALAGAYLVGLRLRRRRALRFTNVALLDKVAPRRSGWGRHVVAVLQLVGIGIGLLAFAQPQDEVRVPKERATIVLAMDTSLSMKATDVSPSRIAAAKKAAVAFVRSIPEKLNVGLVSFDGSARVDVTPTTDRSSVVRAITSLQLHEGTAIGDAVEVSLDAIARAPKDASGKKAPGVIVLLSDGSTTMGIPTADAGPIAKKAGIPVWTIAYGTPNGVVDITLPDTGETARIQVPVDVQALSQLADQSGGKAFTAASASDLTDVYQQMGSAIGYDTEQRDVTTRYVAAAMAVLVLTGMAAAVWFQRLP